MLEGDLKPEFLDARVNGANVSGQGIKLVDGKLVGVPVGGPYTISCTLSTPGSIVHQHVLVALEVAEKVADVSLKMVDAGDLAHVPALRPAV